MMLEIALDADEEWDSSRPWQNLARKAAEAAIAESAFPDLAEQVRELNAEWRGKDKATNVLSFPMADELDFTRANFDGPELLLGDIVLARGVCAAEAAEKGVSLEDHATHLLVHGTLHLLGYDHHDDGEAVDMELREVRALRRLGIANPYEFAA